MDVSRLKALLPVRAPVTPPSALPESPHDERGTTPGPEDASRFFLLLAEQAFDSAFRHGSRKPLAHGGLGVCAESGVYNAV